MTRYEQGLFTKVGGYDHGKKGVSGSRGAWVLVKGGGGPGWGFQVFERVCWYRDRISPLTPKVTFKTW